MVKGTIQVLGWIASSWQHLPAAVMRQQPLQLQQRVTAAEWVLLVVACLQGEMVA
jgi:hypothetical protein